MAIMKESEPGIQLAGLIRYVGISKQTFAGWEKKYDSLEVNQASRPGFGAVGSISIV